MRALALAKVKRRARHALGEMLGVKAGRMVREIGRAEIISFDIFDTLVKRKVEAPEDVHRLVCQEFLGRTGTAVSGYQEKRAEAEREARKRKGVGEITLKDIFRCMHGIPGKDKKILRELEEKTELSVCYPDPQMKRVYGKALKDGKRVIITSDMYLDEGIIKQILHKCGYGGYERLYLSSAYNMRKSTGQLYGAVREAYPGFGGRILHIGDNVKSDYIIPRVKGIRALLACGGGKGKGAAVE